MKLGLIGCGYWGPKCIRVLKDIEGCDLAWIADTDASRLEPYKEQGYRTTQEYQEILQDEGVTGMLVLTPASSHYAIIKKCLEAGKHVFVEKPLTTSSIQAEELVSLAESRNLKLITGHIYVFHPAIEHIKQAIQQQEFTSPLHFHFQRRSPGPVRDDVNVLWDLGPHEVSMLLHLVGSAPTHISAIGIDILGRGRPDIVSANLTFANNITSSMIFSWVDPVKIRDLTIVGSQKILTFNDMAAEKLSMFHTNQPESAPMAVTIAQKEPLREELQHFVRCLETNQDSRVSGRDGVAVVKVLEDIDRVMQKQ